jgi:hypothetical protein
MIAIGPALTLVAAVLISGYTHNEIGLGKDGLLALAQIIPVFLIALGFESGVFQGARDRLERENLAYGAVSVMSVGVMGVGACLVATRHLQSFWTCIGLAAAFVMGAWLCFSPFASLWRASGPDQRNS